QAAGDEHGRVRMEAIVAASWLSKNDGLTVLNAAEDRAKAGSTSAATDARVTLDAAGVLHFASSVLKSGAFDTITISAVGNNQTLNLAEAEVISGGKNVAAQATLTQSSRYDDEYVAALLVDGNHDNFAHTATEANPWFALSFPQPISVDEVRIVNRAGYESRFKTGQLTFSRDGKKILSIKAELAGPSSVPGMDAWTSPVFETAKAYLQGQAIVVSNTPTFSTHLTGESKTTFQKGAEVYSREGHCITCHQPDGKGLPAALFPPLAGSKWVTGNETRLIKLVQHGLIGPIKVAGVEFPGTVPMTPFKALSDEEMAAVLSFVRNTFGNKASIIDVETVRQVREVSKGKVGFYQTSELLQEHPFR
ncbi:MAG: mono/diheme cytochrome c family protein, partial [Rhodothermales bacterium]